MITVSNAYKSAMRKQIRDRGYIKINLGVLNQYAQGSAKVIDSPQTSWSNNKTLFGNDAVTQEYATMEQNYLKVDGSKYFLNEEYGFFDTGYITMDIKGSLKFEFKDVYEIKGLTIGFGSVYPTVLEVSTDTQSLRFNNTSSNWDTKTYFGNTKTLTIRPVEMVGGEQRLHIKQILMGTTLSFDNTNVSNMSLSRSISTISEELPSDQFSMSALDPNNDFDIDSDASFINFLTTEQELDVYYGQTLESGEIEYVHTGHLYLTDWSASTNTISFTAKDRLAFLEDEYWKGDKIYTRSAYAEAQQILQDAGLEVDEYYIDDYLYDVELVNPLPTTNHKNALQLVANACRSIVYTNQEGQIIIRPNFEQVIEPEQIHYTGENQTEWSFPEAVKFGNTGVYADMSSNMISSDGSMMFMPADSSEYLQNGYYSVDLADEDGNFELTPKLTLQLEAAFRYVGVNIEFGSQPPQELTIRTYKNGEVQESVPFTDLSKEGYLYYDFSPFDKMEFEVTKGNPHGRVMIAQISLGDVTDYVIYRKDMFGEPVGTNDERTKAVHVAYYSYVGKVNEQGQPVISEKTGFQEYEQSGDTMYVKTDVNTTGINQYLENPLVHTTSHAQTLGIWLKNYYANSKVYDVSFRGDPKIEPADLIKMESDRVGNLTTEISKMNLTFNGGLRESMTLRRALKLSSNY